MDPSPDDPRNRRHVWPWFVLVAVLLAVVLAIAWMSVAIRHVEESRDPMAQPAQTGNGPKS